MDSLIKHIHDNYISCFSPGADPHMCPKDTSLSLSFILLLTPFLWRIKQRENSLHWTAPSGSRNSSSAINNEDEELLCQNTGVHHCSSTCVLLARLYLQRDSSHFHGTLVLKSFNKQNVNFHPLLRSPWAVSFCIRAHHLQFPLSAEKGRRWNLAKNLLTNCTDQWLLKHSFKNNSIHSPTCIASLLSSFLPAPHLSCDLNPF